MNGQDNAGRHPNPIRLFSFYLPVTWYFFLFAVCCILGYSWINTFEKLPDTAYADILPLLVSVAFWFLVAILSLSLLTVVVSFVFFQVKKKRQGIEFRVETHGTSIRRRKQRQEIYLSIHPVLKPFLGFLKIRLQYDEEHFSNKFSIVEQQKNKLISTTVEGTYNWQLPVIKEYRIEKAILYFEDFFQFFSFAVTLQTNNRFYTQPQDTEGKTITTFPRKTENTNTRIEEIKRVEGEYINYKNFEGNDDVRRIVWKIYARNKELVVRIPEVLDPYASHVYLYASFYSHFGRDLGEVIQIPFLNYYKTFIWSVYRQLIQQGFDVRYLPDQPVAMLGSDPQQNVKHTISVSHWQTDKDLRTYVNAKDAAMILVSSVSDAEQVQQLAEQYGNDISLVFVKLTDSLGNPHFGDWLQWLFVQNEKNATAEYKRKWNFTMLRSKIIANEKRLAAVLSQFARSEVIEA